MLLLAEATSHLDAITEAAVHANVASLGCTTIVIAHRLSSLQSPRACQCRLCVTKRFAILVAAPSWRKSAIS